MKKVLIRHWKIGNPDFDTYSKKAGCEFLIGRSVLKPKDRPYIQTGTVSRSHLRVEIARDCVRFHDVEKNGKTRICTSSIEKDKLRAIMQAHHEGIAVTDEHILALTPYGMMGADVRPVRGTEVFESEGHKKILIFIPRNVIEIVLDPAEAITTHSGASAVAPVELNLERMRCTGRWDDWQRFGGRVFELSDVGLPATFVFPDSALGRSERYLGSAGSSRQEALRGEMLLLGRSLWWMTPHPFPVMFAVESLTQLSYSGALIRIDDTRVVLVCCRVSCARDVDCFRRFASAWCIEATNAGADRPVEEGMHRRRLPSRLGWLLANLFSGPELRRFIQSIAFDLLADLPGESVSPTDLACSAVGLLERRGFAAVVVEDRLREFCPGQASLIRRTFEGPGD